MDEQRIQVANHVLHCRVDGDGPVVLLLHGSGSTSEDWAEIIARLAPSWRAVAPDLRGFGESDRTPGQYRLDDFAADLVTLLPALTDVPAFVVGHSFGAAVAHQLAVRSPELVRAVVLEEPPLYLGEWREAWWGTPGFALTVDLLRRGADEEEIHRALAEAAGDERLVTGVARAFVSTDPEILEGIATGTAHAELDTDALLAALRVPALIAHGDASLGGTVRPEDVTRAQRVASPHVSWRHFAGVGHAIHRARPDEFVALLESYFAEVT